MSPAKGSPQWWSAIAGVLTSGTGTVLAVLALAGYAVLPDWTLLFILAGLALVVASQIAVKHE